MIAVNGVRFGLWSGRGMYKTRNGRLDGGRFSFCKRGRHFCYTLSDVGLTGWTA